MAPPQLGALLSRVRREVSEQEPKEEQTAATKPETKINEVEWCEKARF